LELFWAAGSLAMFAAIRLASVPREQFRCCSSARLILKTDIRKFLSGAVLHGETCGRFLNGPGRGKAAGGHRRLSRADQTPLTPIKPFV
jgi:hypothetical protein